MQHYPELDDICLLIDLWSTFFVSLITQPQRTLVVSLTGHPTMSSPLLASSERKCFKIGTRKSKLALAQTDLVVEALKKKYPQYDFNIETKDTAGDRDKITAFKDMTSKNLWTEELEELLIGGQIDFIVHSLKGMRLNVLYL